MEQVFALRQIFGKLWKYAKEVNACFTDVEQAFYDRVLRDKLWGSFYSMT